MQIHPYYHSRTKRAFDIVLGFILLVVLSPVFAGISLLIMLTAGWPIFFHQKRIGINKKSFTIHKFRVMYKGADKHQWRHRQDNEAPEPMYKNWHDPRYVGLGRWLSKIGFDELPQLLNILKGEMSFVGPRPLPHKEAAQLTPQWNFRYQVKPGVFSQWSLATTRHDTLSGWKHLEQKTVQYGSVWNDLAIITKTIIKVLTSI
jgi:lipopolysaccharide/colanic/teichoic acid biosynthesis glycosyltransferase